VTRSARRSLAEIGAARKDTTSGPGEPGAGRSSFRRATRSSPTSSRSSRRGRSARASGRSSGWGSTRPSRGCRCRRWRSRGGGRP